MKNKFTCIVCDPPYGFSDKLKQSEVEPNQIIIR